ncbi:OmpA-OmpF porin, OOP family [Tistlia consotensis]|uniref:OmpA-OmpF porin, OOP family n=1 Tax=Tistlia consotensis USBA 355 TaxID=560819 RepID=A0A1Y6CGP8_9PROT|nr:OmpA family protein [Tistlia consotensis]SMF55123.1 OmpA-OmpF porin, OOP family [Tistlia consotensis USBA 355]SNR87707.1 OmpA-OmpF porin, OOP family [Tistlia consotensis]
MAGGSPRRSGFAALVAALALSACTAGPFDAGRLATAKPPESAFDRVLVQEYVQLGDLERAEEDWQDAAGFYRRAEQVAAAERVEPEALEARDLPAADRPVLAAARDRLTRALAGGARALTPEAAARAQAGFDCWMQEQEEAHQPDDIAACRQAFETAMAEVERSLNGAVVVLLADAHGAVGAVDLSNARGSVTLSSLRATAVVPGAGAAPDAAGTLASQDVEEIFGRALAAQPAAPVTVRLYFETGTDRLTPASQAELPAILDLIRKRVVPGVEIAGHTDRVGSATINDRLALRRAELVRDMVLKLGVPSRLVRVESFGERDPVIPTADGVDEPRNRRVEITVR